MKTIIGILAMLLITVSVSGQLWKNKRSQIEHGEVYERTRNGHNANTNEDLIHEHGFYGDNNIFWLEYWAMPFIANGRVFMLAYEPVSGQKATRFPDGKYGTRLFYEREVFLYSKELSKPKSEWEIASVNQTEYGIRDYAVVVCTYKDEDNNDWIDFFPYNEKRHNTSIGSIKEFDDGKVELVFGVRGEENGSVFFKKETVVFTPVDDKHYTFRKK